MGTRYERVVLDLEDRLSGGMVKAAGSTALLNRELGSLSKQSVQTQRSVSDIDRPVGNLGRSSDRSSKEVDKLSGRMRILADVALILGPALIPIATVGVPAVTGLAAQLGFAAVAGGTAVLAFQGVGGAVKALNEAALKPTQANLEKAQVALERLSPAAQGFVAEIGHMIPGLRVLRDLAAEGLLPGATEGLQSLETALPHVQGLIAAVSGELGTLAAEAGASLASPKWTDFLDFVAENAPQALGEMAQAAGNTAHAVAALWMATDPLNDDFSSWLVDATADLDRWATGLSKTEGFAEFIDYVETTGPQVAETFGAIANAALQIVEAAAPLGGPALAGIEAVAKMVAAVADSDIGTPIFAGLAALALLNRSLAITSSLEAKTFGGPAIASIRGTGASMRGLAADVALVNRESALLNSPSKGFIGPLTQAQTALGRVKASAATLGKSAALIGGIGIAATGAADGVGLTNTASLALMGTFISPGWGTALGGAAGALLDVKSSTDSFNDSMREANRLVKSNDVSAIEAKIAELKRQRDDLGDVTGFGDFFGDIGSNLAGRGTFGSSAIDRIDSKLALLQDRLKVTKAEAAEGFSRDGFDATAAGIDGATESTEDFLRKLQDLNDVLAGRASFRAYEQALDDFTDRQKQRADVLKQIADEQAKSSVSDVGIDRDLAAAKGDLAGAKTPAQRESAQGRIADLEARQTAEHKASLARIADLKAEAKALENSINPDLQQGRDTLDLLDAIGAKAAAWAATMTDPVQRTEFLAAARAEYEKAAIAAGYAADAAKDLADDVFGLSGVVGTPSIVIDPDGAYHVIDLVQRRLDRMRDKQLKITITADATQGLKNNIPQILKNRGEILDAHGLADGGTVPGSRYPYRDSVLTLLAGTEEIIPNRHGEADQFRADRAAGRIPAYADGGTVGRVSTAAMASAPAIDYDRLTRAMLAARPLIGEQTVMPHDYNEFRRQQQENELMVGIGGPPR